MKLASTAALLITCFTAFSAHAYQRINCVGDLTRLTLYNATIGVLASDKSVGDNLDKKNFDIWVDKSAIKINVSLDTSARMLIGGEWTKELPSQTYSYDCSNDGSELSCLDGHLKIDVNSGSGVFRERSGVRKVKLSCSPRG